MTMRYLSICSGIEAASVAWHVFGWTPVAFSEIEPFPSAVLKHHYADVPNLGDMSKFNEWPEDLLAQVDLIVGGTPCQAFSVAGLRAGLADARGNLTLIYIKLVERIHAIRSVLGLPPPIVVWENVPGVFSDKTGAFNAFLTGLSGEDEALGVTKWPRAGMVDGTRRRVAWSVLDAQYFGVSQRRRRVFVVAVPQELVRDLGERACPAEILSVGTCLRGDTPTRGETWKGIAESAVPGVAGSLDTQCGGGKLTHQTVKNGHVIGTITARMFSSLGARDVEEGALLPVVKPISFYPTDGRDLPTLHDLSLTLKVGSSGTSGNPPGVAIPFDTTQITSPSNYSNPRPGDPCHPLAAGAHAPAVAFAQNSRDELRLMGGDGQIVGALAAEPGMKQTCYIAQPVAPCLSASNDPSRSPQSSEVTQQVAAVYATTMQVRRLTPRECERLQGFPDDYTLIPWRKGESPDGPRYKALGNSMAVPVMRWIGSQINKSITMAMPRKENG